MKGYIIDQSFENLAAAFAALQPMPKIEYEYRVYYDPITRVCLFNTIEKPEGTYLVITKEQYDLIYCPAHYFINKSGELEQKLLDLTSTKLLQLSDSGFRTLKNNNIFIVNDSYTNATDCWTTRI